MHRVCIDWSEFLALTTDYQADTESLRSSRSVERTRIDSSNDAWLARNRGPVLSFNGATIIKRYRVRVEMNSKL